MILTLGHTKGGVGKSTLALNIAIERLRTGVDTLIVDGDPKQTSISKASGIHDFRVLAVLNRAKPAGRDNADTIAVIREYSGIELIPASLGNRSIFSSAFGRGQSVAEYRPSNRKAAAELATLMLAIYG